MDSSLSAFKQLKVVAGSDWPDSTRKLYMARLGALHLFVNQQISYSCGLNFNYKYIT